jgi:hypothetical protein
MQRPSIVRLSAALSALGLCIALPVLAQAPQAFQNYGYTDPLGGVTVPQLVGRVIAQILPFVGTLFLVMFMYGGYQWFSSGGDAKKTESARNTLTNAVIGMTIVLAAYALVSYIVTSLGTAVSG